jgi:hypothetical protein
MNRLLNKGDYIMHYIYQLKEEAELYQHLT